MCFVQKLKGCCLSENVAQGKEPEVQTSQLRNSKPVRLLPLLVHVVPVALIQFLDFVTDVFVIQNFYKQDGTPFFGAWKVAVGGLLFSTLASWYNIIAYAGGGDRQLGESLLTKKEQWIACLLAPINLHVLAIGTIFAIRADERDDRAEKIYENSFLWLKHNESCFEGVPLALITIGAIKDMDVDLNKKMLFYSSLILTLLSISYGIFGLAASIFERHICGRRSQLFACMSVDAIYTILTLGVCFGSPALGIFRLLIPFVLILISFVWVMLDIYGHPDIPKIDEIRLVILVPMGLLMLVTMHSIQTCVIDKPFWYGSGNYPLFNLRIFPIARRALLGVASFAVIVTDSQKAIACILGILCMADIFASTRMFRLAGLADWDAFSIFHWKKNKANFALVRSSSQLSLTSCPDENVPLTFKNGNVELAITNDRIYNYDVLEFIISKASRENEVPEWMLLVITRCNDLIAQLDTLADYEHTYLMSVLKAYLPSGEGDWDAEKRLLELLSYFEDGPVLSTEASSGYVHPMRAMPLGNALQISLWDTKPSFFGKKPLHTAYHLSEDCDRCNWFISHAWNDDGEQKLKMLREYLFLQDLLGLWVTTFLFLSAFLVPVGFAVHSMFERLPGWSLSVVTVIVMFVFLLWVLISIKNMIPSRFAPWSFSRQTVWLDKCCIDQSTPETIDAGAHSFQRFLDNCDGMVAFVSATYFSRIWCVYELASFCKILERHPERRLLLFSLEWPSSIKLWKSSKISQEESLYFKHFRCRDAECFKPADRGYVLREIREEWGSEQTFDEFVRTKLPTIFAESKQIYSEQLMTVANRSLEQLFGA